MKHSPFSTLRKRPDSSEVFKRGPSPCGNRETSRCSLDEGTFEPGDCPEQVQLEGSERPLPAAPCTSRSRKTGAGTITPEVAGMPR